jgi:hypothetical protein
MPDRHPPEHSAESPRETRTVASPACSARRRLERAIDLGLVVVVVGLGVLSWDRATRGRFDFDHFYLDARYVWEHRALNPNLDDPDPDQRRQLPFYLPAVALLLSPLTALGRQPAALLWATVQVAALGYSLSALRRWSTAYLNRAPAGVAFAVAILLALPALLEAAKFNQLSFVVLALVLGATQALDRDRPLTAGALLGFASVLKLLPAVFLVWLLLKRRFAAAGVLAATVVLVAGVPTLLVFGARRTLEYHQQWWQYNLRGDAAQGLLNPDLREHFIDWRNQSIAQVLARLTWPEHPYAAPFQPLRLQRETCAWLARGLGALLLAGVAWRTRRPWTALSVERRHAEAAVYALGMLVFSPLLRQYYLVWAIPALVLLASRAALAPPSVSQEPPRKGSAVPHRLGWAGLMIWVLGMLGWLWRLARVCGVQLFMLIALGVLLLRATREPPPAARGNGAGN